MPSAPPPPLHPHLSNLTRASSLPKAVPDSPTSSLPASARGRDAPLVSHRALYNTSLTTLVCFTCFELSEFKDSISSPLSAQNLAQSKHSLKACRINAWRARHVHKTVEQNTCPIATAPWIIITTTFKQVWLLDLLNSCSYQLPFLKLNFPLYWQTGPGEKLGLVFKFLDFKEHFYIIPIIPKTHLHW